MCCFRLHFSKINVLFCKKNKNLFQLTFKKNTCCAKREKKITCHEEKSRPPSLPDIKWSLPNYAYGFNLFFLLLLLTMPNITLMGLFSYTAP